MHNENRLSDLNYKYNLFIFIKK